MFCLILFMFYISMFCLVFNVLYCMILLCFCCFILIDYFPVLISLLYRFFPLGKISKFYYLFNILFFHKHSLLHIKNDKNIASALIGLWLNPDPVPFLQSWRTCAENLTATVFHFLCFLFLFSHHVHLNFPIFLERTYHKWLTRYAL